MVQRELYCFLVIQDDIRNARHRVVPGHGDRRNGGRFLHRGIDRDEPFHSARLKELRVTGHHLWIVPVDNRQEEVIALLEVLLDAADDLRTVSIADLRCNYTDCESTPKPERAGKKLGR